MWPAATRQLGSQASGRLWASPSCLGAATPSCDYRQGKGMLPHSEWLWGSHFTISLLITLPQDFSDFCHLLSKDLQQKNFFKSANDDDISQGECHPIPRTRMSWSDWAAITEYHRLGGWNNKHVRLTVLGAGKSKIKALRDYCIVWNGTYNISKQGKPEGSGIKSSNTGEKIIIILELWGI